MNKVISVIITSYIVLVGFVLGTEPYTTSVTTNATLIASARPMSAATAWATNVTYSLGQKVKANDLYYFAIIAGTSATSGTGPSHVSGDAADATVTWRAIPRGTRSGISIQNNSTNHVFIAIGGKAESGKGIRLNGLSGATSGGIWWSDTDPICQTDIWAINDSTDSGTNAIISVEW